MIGLFIMDVSSSTAYYNTEELSSYLTELEQKVMTWKQHLSHSYVNYRMGDELFFVSESPSSTLVLAYYIKLLWPFKKQPVKFGIAVGEAKLPDDNFEHWNHPIIKQARLALDDIKSNDMTDFKLWSTSDCSLYNDVLFYYLTDIVQQQTAVQREILLNSFVQPVQKELAARTERSVSTISAHLKKGRAKQLALIEQTLAAYDECFDDRIRTAVKSDIGEMMKWSFK